MVDRSGQVPPCERIDPFLNPATSPASTAGLFGKRKDLSLRSSNNRAVGKKTSSVGRPKSVDPVPDREADDNTNRQRRQKIVCQSSLSHCVRLDAQ
jgi:hypothetical protein